VFTRRSRGHKTKQELPEMEKKWAVTAVVTDATTRAGANTKLAYKNFADLEDAAYENFAGLKDDED
jgi:hypothetical protein